MSGKHNPISVYARVSQLAFVILAPLLFFIAGGYYVVKHFELPDWVMGVCVVLGIVFMIGGAVSYGIQLIRTYAKDDPKKSNVPRYYSDPRDNDYYDEYKDLHK